MYCKPKSLNFESLDAVILPNTFVQIFKRKKGDHGYKLDGLKKVDEVLKSEKYELWSCVPMDLYKQTKFQSWITTAGDPHKLTAQDDKALVQKMEQYVVEVDYKDLLANRDK
jgi:predicted phosphohydrolase